MSTLILSSDDIRKAVQSYYSDYEPEIYRRFNFDDVVLGIDGDSVSMEIEQS